MIRSILIISYMLLGLCSLRAEDAELDDLLRRLYGRESFVDNRYIVGLDYGFVYPLGGNPLDIREAWNTELRYGFDRYYPTKDIGIIYYRQEVIVLGNVSPDFGPWNWSGSVNNDVWYGKIAIKDGYGYDTKYGRVTLNHATAFGWGVNDIQEPLDNEFYNAIDEVIKPMAAYNSSFRIEWENGLALFTTAGERQFFNESTFGGRVGSMALEGAFYLIPDLAEDTLIDMFGDWYPWVHRSYNSMVSFLFYYMRHHINGDWPFNTGEASTTVVLRLGFDYRIE